MKGYIDDKITAISGIPLSKDVQRATEFLNRYESTYTKLKESIDAPINTVNVYRVPAMKYGRLDGYTFPMEYNLMSSDPYDITMAKGEYKSIAILLDPAGDFNKTIEFTNSVFDNGGEGITLDKYVAKIWYQSGKDDSIFDMLYDEDFQNYSGDAWLTQELLLKNDALVKTVRHANESNMLYYKGDNFVYTKRGDGSIESFGDHGVVPGYLQVTSPYNTYLPDQYYKVNTKVSRYNFKANVDDALQFDDTLTIQPFNVGENGEYKLLWGIIHVDRNTPSGVHSSNIELQVDGGDNITIPLKVTVSDYELSESVLDYGLYYHSSISGEAYDPGRMIAQSGAISKTQVQHRKDLLDMRKHGITHPIVELKDLTRYEITLNYMDSIGYPTDKTFATIGKYFARSSTTVADLKALVIATDNTPYQGADLYTAIVDEASISQITDSKRFIRDVMDVTPEISDIKVWGGTFKSAIDYLSEHSANGTPYLDAPILSGKASSDVLKRYQDAGAEVYKYGHPQAGVENPEIYRRNFGISMYKQGHKGGGMNYAYQKQYGFFWNDFDLSSKEKNHREEAFTYPTTGLVGKGFVGTIQWEGYREAITDMRYISTLIEKDGEVLTKEFVKTLDLENGNLDEIRKQIINRLAH